MAFERVVERAEEMLLVHQREELRRLVDRDHLHVEAEVAGARPHQLEEVHGARACRPASTPPVMWMPQDWPEIASISL